MTTSGDRLPTEFYQRDARDVAVALLGKQLVRRHENHKLSGYIIETEAYL